MGQAQEDGYVECSECGHTIEYDHDRNGCTLDPCRCRAGFTVAVKRDIRAREGLPRTWPRRIHR